MLGLGTEEEVSLQERISIWESQKDTSYEKIHDILFSEHKQEHKQEQTATVPQHVYSDLEYFVSNSEKGNTVLKSFGRTQTPYGECILRHLLQNPLIDSKAIEERQWVIRKFYDHPIIMKKIERIWNIWNEFQDPQDLLWLWREEDENSKTLHDIVYYQTPLINNILNSSEWFLCGTSVYSIFLSPCFNILSPLLCFIVPYVVIRSMGFHISFSQVFHLLRRQVFSVSFLSNKTVTMAIISAILWFVIYSYNAYTIYQYASFTNKITNIIHKKLQVVAKAIKVSRALSQLSEMYPNNIKDLLNISECDISTEILLMRDTIFAQPSLFRNKGCILSTFWKIKSHLPDLAKRARMIGYFDAFYTITRYLKNIEKAGLHWTYSLFGEKRVISQFWHPILWKNDENKKKPVSNSLKLKKKVRAILLTGPNAAGKSTLVRAILVNSLLAQTLGIVMAKKWSMQKTFCFIDTYLNVPDVEGHMSLFQAEMARCLEFLQTLERMKSNISNKEIDSCAPLRGLTSALRLTSDSSLPDDSCRAIIALDEVFSSTNFKEGFSAAYAVVQYLSQNFPDLFCLITTHFHGLTNLEKDTKGKVKNYCLSVNRDKQGKITGYPFKVKRGVSQEHVALDLLEQNGFSHSILQTARRIYENIEQPALRSETRVYSEM